MTETRLRTETGIGSVMQNRRRQQVEDVGTIVAVVPVAAAAVVQWNVVVSVVAAAGLLDTRHRWSLTGLGCMTQ